MQGSAGGWRGTGRAVAIALIAVLGVATAGAPALAQTEQDESRTGEPVPGEEAEERTEGESAAASDEVEGPGVLDQIVVTARKRTQNLQEVPLSISTLDTEEVEALTAGGQDIRFLSGRVPSVVLESSFGRAFPRFYIRGLGNTDFDLNASQPVSVVYDEVVLENPVLKGLPVWDIDRVEVLRGPQGTLFGRNTPAGIVKLESRRPTRELDGFARASFGTLETAEAAAAVGGPLGESLSYRVSGLFRSRSDWVDNENEAGREETLGGYQSSAARVQLLYEPNDRFDGLLNLHGWDLDGTARIFRANIIEPGTDRLVDGFEHDEVFHDGLNDLEIEARGGSLRLEWDFGATELVSITGYESLEMFSRGDIDGGYGAVFAPPSGPGTIPFPSETADGIPDLEQITQEVRLASIGDRRLHWLVGVFLFDEDLTIDTFSFDTLGGNVQDGYSVQRQQAEAWGLFASLDLRLTERWHLEAGVRYSNDEKDFAAERPDPTFNTATAEPITESTEADFTSWDVTASYEVSPQMIVYGRVATSFRAPSIQGRILFCPDFAGGTDPATDCVSVAEEEDIFSTEVGMKSEWLDRKLRLNLTAYRYQVDGQQITAVGGQFNTATLLNADETEGYGFEADIRIAPRPEWKITLGISNNQTEIQDEDLTVAPCAGGCTILDPVTPSGNVLVDGNSLPHAPEWIFNGIVDYRRSVGGGLLLASLDWAYHDEKRFFLYESEEFRSDSFEVGLRLGYTFAEARHEVALYGRNITDEEIVRNGIDFNNLTGMTNDPATWGVELVTRF